MALELIFNAGSTLLEGPVWDAVNQLIYCVSIDQGMVYQINVNTTNVKSFSTNGNVGCVALLDDGTLLAAEKNGIVNIDPNSCNRTFVTQLESNPELRYNDGKLDPIGRFIVGTKSERDYFIDNNVPRGKLFSYYKGNCQTLLTDLIISNGIGFSLDHTLMYFIDSPTKKVNQYKYDIVTGTLQFDRPIIYIDGNGYPDGMCVDLEGNLWVAEWEGSRVRKWNPNTGACIAEVRLPCDRVTSCCLGGINLTDLYITTAKKENDMLGGSLFKITI